MPLYNYYCHTCGADYDVLRPLSAYNDPYQGACGHQAVLRIQGALIIGDYAGYESPVTGKWIEGRRAHREELARTGCRLYEKGETEAFLKAKRERQANFDRAVEQVVEQAAKEL